jgi:hypothetical protein
VWTVDGRSTYTHFPCSTSVDLPHRIHLRQYEVKKSVFNESRKVNLPPQVSQGLASVASIAPEICLSLVSLYTRTTYNDLQLDMYNMYEISHQANRFLIDCNKVKSTKSTLELFLNVTLSFNHDFRENKLISA